MLFHILQTKSLQDVMYAHGIVLCWQTDGKTVIGIMVFGNADEIGLFPLNDLGLTTKRSGENAMVQRRFQGSRQR